MTSIPGTDLTTEAARNIAARVAPVEAGAVLVALADAYDTLTQSASITEAMTLSHAIDTAKSVADRDKFSPQEAAAAWDVVDALMTLRSARERVTPDHDQEDRDGKQISRAAEAEEHTDDCD